MSGGESIQIGLLELERALGAANDGAGANYRPVVVDLRLIGGGIPVLMIFCHLRVMLENESEGNKGCEMKLGG